MICLARGRLVLVSLFPRFHLGGLAPRRPGSKVQKGHSPLRFPINYAGNGFPLVSGANQTSTMPAT